MTITEFSQKYRLRLRRTEDGEQISRGKYGEIYQHGDGFLGVLVMPNGHRPRLWPGARRRLEAVGCTIWQNGDHEGSVVFDPANLKQCRLVLMVIGAKRKRIPSPAQLATLEKATSARFARNQRAEGALEPQNDLIPAEMVGVGV